MGTIIALSIVASVLLLTAHPVRAWADARQEEFAPRGVMAAGSQPSNVCDLTSAPITNRTYTVQPGDTLGVIAQGHGTNWSLLADLNHLSNPNLIFPGQSIQLCGTAANHGAAGGAPSTASLVPAAPVTSALNGEFCQSPVFATSTISAWTVPPGCYGAIYQPNPANYVARPNFGWCNWWPEVMHPGNPAILFGLRHSQPLAGSVVVFDPGVQGASADGHYGQVVAILNGGWLLISEMNFYWRGGGFGLVDYRYIHLGSGVSFIY